jgi:Phage Mu protein F like protein
MQKLNYSDEEIKKLINDIYEGIVDIYNLPEPLYLAIAEQLKSGLYHGFGGVLSDFKGSKLELLNELRENIYMFSAAKTATEVESMQSLMFDENGDLRNINEFSRLAGQEFDLYNDSYGRTEYNTAVAQAEMASKWDEIQRTKDVLPLLVYQTIGEGLGCEICSPLDGLTAPVDDPIWDSVYPTNHFNCECIVIQEDRDNATETDRDSKDAIVSGVKEEMNPIFQMNCGKDGYVFSPEHPYFQVEPKHRELAKNNFNLPIPEED